MYGLPDARKPGVRYVVYVLLVMITLVAVMTWAIILYNWTFENTFLMPAVAPNGLITQRNGAVYWVLFPITVLRILALVACIARSANTYNRWYKHIVTLVAFVGILAEIAALVIFIIERNGCNNPPGADPSGRNNLCNDYRYCCVYGTSNITHFLPNSTVEPSCPILLAPCVPAVLASDLTDNWVFDASLASTVIFIAIYVMHILISGWMKDGSEAASYYEMDGNDGNNVYDDGGFDMESNINGASYDGGAKFTNDPYDRNIKTIKKK